MKKNKKRKYTKSKKYYILKNFSNDLNIEIPKPRIETPKLSSNSSYIRKNSLFNSKKQTIQSSGTFNFDINKNLKKGKKPRIIIKYNIDDFEELI